MNTEQTIKDQIAQNNVLLYMKGTPDFPQCGFSARAVQILRECGAEFASINILEHPEIRSTLPTMMNWPTFPQLYVKGELVGGSDIMVELFQQGELQKILAA